MVFAMRRSVVAFNLFTSRCYYGYEEQQVKDLGDYYGGEYTPGNWNYNYSQWSTNCPSVCSTDNKCGPACWSRIVAAEGDPLNLCGGNRQTPIDFTSTRVDPGLSFKSNIQFEVIDDGCSSWAQFANDHVFEVSFKKMNCANLKVSSNLRCYLAGNCSEFETYTLKQLHFHTPSEHTVGSELADGEVHMVHLNTPGTHAFVIGSRLRGTPLYKASDDNLNNRPTLPVGNRTLLKSSDPHAQPADRIAPNSFLSSFWDVWKQASGGTADLYEVTGAEALNPYKDFLPASKTFFTYSGSLTTYPCSEIVTWVVFEDSVVVFPEDIENLRKAVAASPYTLTFTS